MSQVDQEPTLEARVADLERALALLSQEGLEAHEDNVLLARVAAAMEDVQQRLDGARRLDAFFAPVLAGKSPPLDGAEVATKAFVDDAIRRLAGSLRAELQRELASVRWWANPRAWLPVWAPVVLLLAIAALLVGALR